MINSVIKEKLNRFWIWF